MPTRNIVKVYAEKGYYHIYNGGVEKRNIFLEKEDCSVFLHYLKMYLSPLNELKQLSLLQPRASRFISLNLSGDLSLLSFSLMPNHFHLQIKQQHCDTITKFMRRLSTSYVMYFNKKYRRIGALFQNNYKGVLIEDDSYLLHLSRYIHLNPLNIKSQINFSEFSSYPYYLGKKKASWINEKEILGYFRSAQRLNLKDVLSYQSFVEDYKESSKEILGTLTLEEDDSE